MGNTPTPPLQSPVPNASPTPTPKTGGFWNILKNRVIPMIGPTAGRLASMYGSPAVRQGAEQGMQYDIQQQELARQRQFDIPALQEAYGRAAQIPSQIQEAASKAELARKQANIAPEDFDAALQQERAKANVQAQYSPMAVPTTGPGGEPQIGMGTISVPPGGGPSQMNPIQIAAPRGAPSPSTPPSAIPTGGGAPAPSTPPPDVFPVKGAMKITPGPWQVGPGGQTGQTAYDQFGREVGVRPGLPPGAVSKLSTPPVQLIPYFRAAGIDPTTATPAQWDQIVNAYNTTESSKSGIHFDKDVNGNVVAIPETTTSTTRTHGTVGAPAPGATPQTSQSQSVGSPEKSPQQPAKPQTKPQLRPRGASTGAAQPITGPDGQPLHGPISAAGKNTLYNIDSTMNLIGDPKNPQSLVAQLNSRVKDNTLWDAAKQRAAWAEYSKLGIPPTNIDPQLAKLLPLIAQVQILGGMPYLRGIRNQKYIAQIQQHVPDPTKDSPGLMVDKLSNLMQTLPQLKQAVYESEGVGTPPTISPGGAAPTGAAGTGSTGPAPKTAADFWQKYKKPGT